MAAIAAKARGRGLLRPLHRRTLPPWHQAHALAPRQGAVPMHDGASEGEEGEFDEAADVMSAAPRNNPETPSLGAGRRPASRRMAPRAVPAGILRDGRL